MRRKYLYGLFGVFPFACAAQDATLLLRCEIAKEKYTERLSVVLYESRNAASVVEELNPIYGRHMYKLERNGEQAILRFPVDVPPRGEFEFSMYYRLNLTTLEIDDVQEMRFSANAPVHPGETKTKELHGKCSPGDEEQRVKFSQ